MKIISVFLFFLPMCYSFNCEKQEAGLGIDKNVRYPDTTTKPNPFIGYPDSDFCGEYCRKESDCGGFMWNFKEIEPECWLLNKNYDNNKAALQEQPEFKDFVTFLCRRLPERNGEPVDAGAVRNVEDGSDPFNLESRTFRKTENELDIAITLGSIIGGVALASVCGFLMYRSKQQ